MIRVSSVLLLAASLGCAQVAPRPVEPRRAPLPFESPLQTKIFYLFSAFEAGPAMRAIAEDPDLVRVANTKTRALQTAATSDCTPSIACYTKGLPWSEEEIGQVAGTLRRLYGSNASVKTLVDRQLRGSGLFYLHREKTGEELLAQAWTDTARGVNRIFDVYAFGTPPRYPAIDAPSHDVRSEAYARLVRVALSLLEDDKAPPKLFFHPSLRVALQLLDINRRDEAARHEPLHLKDNAAPFARAKKVTWTQFPYSAIIIPGSGTQSYMINLSPYAKIRAELGARRWIEGKAPFIIISGGYVHPSQTPHAEAIEMKKRLMSEFKIPAEAILIEPHARHTTTNLRNAVRLIYRYGLPIDKPALIVTDEYHSRYIGEEAFRERCVKELGFVPYKNVRRTGLLELEMTANLESLHGDTMDPLDP